MDRGIEAPKVHCRGVAWMVAVMLLVMQVACGGGGGGGGTPEPGPVAINSGATAAPAIVAQPSDRSVTAGAAVSFSVSATDATAYQWQSSSDAGAGWADLAGATEATYTTAATTLAMNGLRLRVVVRGAGNASVTSSAVQLSVSTVLQAAAVQVPPASTSVVAGGAAQFSVTASGSQLSYVWQASRNDGGSWVDLATPSLPTLTLAAVALADSGQLVRVQVGNSLGTVTSAAAALTVTAVPSLPAFTLQPQNAALVVGQTVVFTAQASADPAPVLRWQNSNDGGLSWFDVSGATGNRVTLGPFAAREDGQLVRAVATNSQGSTVSAVARLTVASAPAAPQFTLQPAGLTGVVGQFATLSANASGVPAPTLQWQAAPPGGSFTNIQGETLSTYNTPALSLADEGRRYRVVASNSAGQVVSAEAVITMRTRPTATVQLEVADRLSRVLAGAPFTLVATVGGLPAPTLQWYVGQNGQAPVAIDGATSARYTAPGLAAGSRAYYYVVATNSFGLVVSNNQFASGAAAELTAGEALVGAAVLVGGSAVIRSAAADQQPDLQTVGVPAAVVQWQTSRDGGSTWADVPGGTAYQLTWANAALADDGRQFRYRASNLAGTVLSGTTTLRVASTAEGPAFGFVPTSRLVTSGTVIGSASNLSWLGIANMPTGIPTPTLELSTSTDNAATWRMWSEAERAMTAADDGRLFRVSASNGAGTVTTLPIRLGWAGTVSNGLQWLNWPNDTEVVEGAMASFRADAAFTGTADSAQWQVSSDGGTSWATATAQAGSQVGPQVLQTLPVTLADHGKQFRFQVRVAGSTFTSGAARLSVRAAPATRLELLAGNAGGLGTLDGPALQARFRLPQSITRDAAGNVYLIDDTVDLPRLRQITPQGEVRTLYAAALGIDEPRAYVDGTTRIDSLLRLSSVVAAPDGTLFVASSRRIWRRAAGEAFFSPLAGGGGGDGTGAAAGFTNISAMALGPDGALTVAEGVYLRSIEGPSGTSANCLRRVSAAGIVTTLAGNCATSGSAGLLDGPADTALFSAPMGVAVDSNGDVYIADAGNHRLRKLAGGSVSTVTGFQPGLTPSGIVQTNGSLASARLYAPQGLAVLAPGVVAVSGLGQVRVVSLAADRVDTWAGGGLDSGADGPRGAAGFGLVQGLSADGAGGLLVADSGPGNVSALSPTLNSSPRHYLQPGNGLVRRVAADGTTGTVAGVRERAGSADGTGAAALMRRPFGLVADAAGNVYVADTGNHTIRRIDRFGAVTTLAGSPGVPGSADGVGASARFKEPRALALAADGALWVADAGNHVVRRVTPAGAVTTVVGRAGQAGRVDGAAADVRLDFPTGVAVLADGRVAITDGGGLLMRQPDGSARRSVLPNAAVASGPDGRLYVAASWKVSALSPDGTSEQVVAGSRIGMAGDGPARVASFAGITALAVDRSGRIWVADGEGQSVRRIAPDGTVTTVLGVTDNDLTRLLTGGWLVYNGGVRLGSDKPRLGYVSGMALLPDGRLVVSSENGVFVATVP